MTIAVDMGRKATTTNKKQIIPARSSNSQESTHIRATSAHQDLSDRATSARSLGMDNSQDFTSDRAVSAHQDSTDRAILARTPNEDLQTEVFLSCSYSLPRDEHHRQVFAEELRKQLRVTFSTQEPAPQSTEPAPTVPGLPQAYDSHFHLDRTHRDLFGTSVIQTTSIEDVLHDTQQVLPNFQVEVVGGVIVFCDPDTFGNIPLMDNRWKTSTQSRSTHRWTFYHHSDSAL